MEDQRRSPKLLILIAILLLLFLTGGRVQAQEPQGREYVVQADDSLARIAEKYYGRQGYSATIVAATNARAAKDDSFRPIISPNVISVGQKLWLPAEPIHQPSGELRLRSWRAGSFVGTGRKVTIPFERKGDNHIFARLRFNGATEPLEVVLDTGSGTTFISLEAARQAGIIPETSMGQYGLTFVDVEIGEAQFTDIGVLISDLHTTDRISPLSCELQHGLIGQNLFRHAIWQIDFQQETITITDDLGELDHIEDAFRLDLIENAQLVLGPHHYVRVGLGETEMLGMIDTGRPTIEIRQLEYLAGGNVLPPDFEGRFFETTIRQLQLGSLTLTGIPITLVDNPSVRPNWFYLGNTLFEDFIVTLDYPGQALYLQPYAAASARIVAAPEPTYGFLPFYDEGDRLVVYRLVRPSAASRAGLERGDRIVRINGDDYARTTYKQACDLWLEGIDSRYLGPITLHVERGNQVLTFTVDKAPVP